MSRADNAETFDSGIIRMPVLVDRLSQELHYAARDIRRRDAQNILLIVEDSIVPDVSVNTIDDVIQRIEAVRHVLECLMPLVGNLDVALAPILDGIDIKHVLGRIRGVSDPLRDSAEDFW